MYGLTLGNHINSVGRIFVSNIKYSVCYVSIKCYMNISIEERRKKMCNICRTKTICHITLTIHITHIFIYPIKNNFRINGKK